MDKRRMDEQVGNIMPPASLDWWRHENMQLSDA